MKKKFLHNIFLIIQKFISSQLFLLSVIIYSLVVVFYRSIIYVFSPFAFYLLMIILCILLSLLIYIKLYTWRNLDRSVSSFIFFSINLLQLTLYLSAISFLFSIWFYHKTLEPIYLENLSVSSQYRYLFLFVISFFFICGFIVFFIANRFMDYKLPNLSLLTYPYLKEEFRILLDTWGAGKMGASFINNLVTIKYYRYAYLSIDYLHILVRLVMALLLFCFCFFGSNFYLLLYFSPIMFIFWLLRFFIYFIDWIIEANSNAIRDCLELSPINPFLLPEHKIGFSFKITSEAIEEGFSEKDLDFLVNQWLELGELNTFLQYRSFIKYFSSCIIVIYFISWSYISYYYFLSVPLELMLPSQSTFGNLFRKSLLWKPPMRHPRDLRHLHERYQNPLKIASKYEFAVGHPVYGELLPDGSYRIDGFLTRNPTYGVNIAKTPILLNKSGDNQNAVPFSTPVIVPANYVTIAVNGSMAILEAPAVKAILDYIQGK